jgi:hypothetical protein
MKDQENYNRIRTSQSEKNKRRFKDITTVVLGGAGILWGGYLGVLDRDREKLHKQSFSEPEVREAFRKQEAKPEIKGDVCTEEEIIIGNLRLELTKLGLVK